MICSNCHKNQAAIFSSKITPNGKREMEGLCINCAKQLGINTDEILNAQNQTIFNSQAQDINKQLEGLFKNLSENFDNIGEVQFGEVPMSENSDEYDDVDNTEPPRVFAGAIPLGSIFGNIFNVGNSGTQEETSGNVKKKVKPEKKKTKNKKKKYLDTFGTNLSFKAQNNELDMVIRKRK